MSQAPHNNISKMFIVSILFIVGLIYTVGYFNTGNAVWFLSSAEVGEPMRIVINDNGDRVAYRPGDPEFAPLAQAIENSMQTLDNNQLISIGLSDDTMDQYNNHSFVVEIHYARPIKFNTSFRAGEPTSLLIPLTGRHAGNGLFFRGHRGEWWYGGMRMGNPEPMYQALENLGHGAAVQASRGGNS